MYVPAKRHPIQRKTSQTKRLVNERWKREGKTGTVRTMGMLSSPAQYKYDIFALDCDGKANMRKCPKNLLRRDPLISRGGAMSCRQYPALCFSLRRSYIPGTKSSDAPLGGCMRAALTPRISMSVIHTYMQCQCCWQK